MACIAVNECICTCSFGMAPAILPATSSPTVIACGQPAATIMDLPKMPFGMCQSLMNPEVSAATSAALGVLTPMPCIPVVMESWIPGSPTVLLEGKPALNQSCKVFCAYEGIIQITMTPALTVQVP